MNSDLLWSLIALQIAMGGFDTIFHHEFTERLAWRASQRHELQLHAIRNGIYAVLFLTLGWLEVHGAWAMAVLGLLAIEIVITLLDFVEEDVSRKLPPSERITHTLLAINYGSVLVIALPILLHWSKMPTAAAFVSHGLWSAMATAAGVGVAFFAARDAVASQRCLRLETQSTNGLMSGLVPGQAILVTGATGFIGRRVVEGLIASGHSVIALVRTPNPANLLARPLTLVTSLDQINAQTRIDAIINLAGEPIANWLWTKAKRSAIVSSRVATTNDVVALIERLTVKPRVLVNGSAIGWYGFRHDEALDESSTAHECFSHEICASWEAAALRAEAHAVRVVMLRIGLVLGTEGGMLARMLTPFEFGLGGRIGNGRQWMSWIERDDLVRLIAHTLSHDEIRGPLNGTAPHPVTNAEFTRTLARALHRPGAFAVPAKALSVLTGDMGRELLIGGQKIMPVKALDSGFEFRHATLDSALKCCVGAQPRSALNQSEASRAANA